MENGPSHGGCAEKAPGTGIARRPALRHSKGPRVGQDVAFAFFTGACSSSLLFLDWTYPFVI